jgi:hypothetical protein
MKKCILIVALLIAASAVTGLQTASNTPIIVKNCQSSDCSGSTCSTSSIPQNECNGGVTYACVASLEKCLDATLFNITAGTGMCSTSQQEGPASFVCNTCMAFANEFGNATVFGTFSNCGTATTVFKHGCDASCASCSGEVPVTMNSCTLNPIDQATAVIVTAVRQCNQVMAQTYWSNENCTGASAGQSFVPAGSCMWDYAAESSEFICPAS